MPYSTGSANDASALKTIIENAAVANGWTLASGILSKGINNVRLTAVDAYTLKLEGSNTADFSSGNAPSYSQIKVGSAYWPVTYHLSVRTSPEFVFCHVNYNTSRYQHLAFGDMTKYGGWTGGNWISAFYSSATTANDPGVKITDIFGAQGVLIGDSYDGSFFYSNSSGAVFLHGLNSGTNLATENSFMHCEIDSQTWLGNSNADSHWVSASPPTGNLVLNAVPAWNQQTLLIPYYLTKNRPSNKLSLIGELPHLRHVMLHNLNPGDTLTLGSDSWIVFPWIQRSTSDKYNGTAPLLGESGVMGIALRYDP
jgi:hypothetical protein